MGKDEAVKFISNYLEGFDANASIADVVYELIVVKGIDKTRLRNILVIRDYDNMWKLQNTTVTSIHDQLAADYNCSQDNIRYIIRNRKFNEL